jgi:methylated-DNA-[protein]-cysteine S-methyltransferase
MKLEKIKINTPLGVVKINGDAAGIHAITFTNKKSPVTKIIPKVLEECVQQLKEYFEGKRISFTITLNPQGTEFQRNAWNSIKSIPYGETMTLAEQSKILHKPKAIRAIANANGKNLLAILVPCHRIIESDTALTKYTWGTERKKWLLNHERNIKQKPLF